MDEQTRSQGQSRTPGRSTGGEELLAIRRSFTGALAGVGVMSGLSNLLMLTGPLFMLEIYDRVLPSRSVPTLVMLSILAVLLYAGQGFFDWLRGRVLVRVSSALDEALSGRIYNLVVGLSLRRGKADSVEPMREVEGIRGFLAGGGPITLLDLPWLPLYLGVVFLLHPLLGIVAAAGGALLFALTVIAELRTKEPARATRASWRRRQDLGEAAGRNAEALTAMGFGAQIGGLWHHANRAHVADQMRTSDVAGGFGTASKSLRLVLQSTVLGIGAWLVIEQQITAGAIIAASILTARALAPVEGVIAHWKGLISARHGWKRLSELLTLLPPEAETLELPAPTQGVSVDGLYLTVPGGQCLAVKGVSFALKAGQGLGIIGPSASGKSCLVRALVGVWSPVRGTVRLDGAQLDQWSGAKRGRHVGYLPQDVELLSGTVAQNIARFDSDSTDQAIVAAAQAAGVHDMIVGLEAGYQTNVGEDGVALSAGQRQRIALARALYGDPFLVVLDEPNSNLDAEGEAALTRAIAGVRRRNGIVVVVAHRPSALAAADTILVMRDGRIERIGPKNDILPMLVRPARPAAQRATTTNPGIATGGAR